MNQEPSRPSPGKAGPTVDRFAVQVERRLAGVLSDKDTDELSRLLERFQGARRLYFRAVEIHLDLGTTLGASAPTVDRNIEEEKENMARISLNCSCSWNFFIPGTTTGHEVTCPSCGQSVRIPGRKPGQDVVRSPGEIAAESQRRQGMVRMAILAMAGSVVVGVALFGYWVVQKPVPDPPPPPPHAHKPPPPPPSPHPPSNPKPPVDPEVVQKPPAQRSIYTAEQIEELKSGVHANVALINMTGLLSECMKYRNLTKEWAQLQADMARCHDKIKHNLNELSRVNETVGLENYLLPEDQIRVFAQRDFTTMTYIEAAAVLHEWVSQWRASSSVEQLIFVRNGKEATLHLQFPTETDELQALVRHPGLGLPGTPSAGQVQVRVSIPAELIKDINDRFDSLPAGYRASMTSADIARLESLTRNLKGSTADVAWLNTRILQEVLPIFRNDADTIKSKVLELEPNLNQNVASDVIYLKDGRKLEGQIIEETPEFVKIRVKLGSVKIPIGEILRIEKGKGTALEFPARFAEAMKAATAAEKLEKLAPLLAWCIEKNLKTQKEYVAHVILTLDASHEKARGAAGLRRPGIPPPK